MSTRKTLITSEEATLAGKQITKPCSDCPWAKKSVGGWVGSLSPEQWVQYAHGEARMDCHVHPDAQCAGAAIYRANICKSPRDKTLLVLPPDKVRVFSRPQDFINHHKSGIGRSWTDDKEEEEDA